MNNQTLYTIPDKIAIASFIHSNKTLKYIQHKKEIKIFPTGQSKDELTSWKDLSGEYKVLANV
jgi:hypothetical protein